MAVLNFPFRQVTDLTGRKANDDSRLFRTISRILIETIANYEIEKGVDSISITV